MPATQSAPFRAIVLTMYSDPPDWDTSLKAKLRYFAYSSEVCPTTGRSHLQGFAYSWKALKHGSWRKLFPGHHVEIMRGNFRENELYCSKEGNLVEFGEKPNNNGEKKGLIDYKEELDKGKSVLEVADENPDLFQTYCMYRNGLKEYAQYKRQKTMSDNRDVPDVFVRIGPPGTGKTRWLDDTFGMGGWITAPDNTGHWFDGCDRDVILFDDVEIGAVPPLSLFKRLTDRYPLQVPVKGGFITWKPKVIVFTANSHPFEWWKDLSDFDKGAIERRMKEVVVVE
nr:replication protein [Mute swan feces associated circular virus 17]